MTIPLIGSDRPAIDQNAIHRFADIVFGYLEGYGPVRAFAEKGTPGSPPVLEFHQTDDMADALGRLAFPAAAQSLGVYVVPGTVAVPGSARAEDIIQTGVVVVDLDTGDIATARDHLTRHIGTPSLAVASGGRTSDGQDKLHLYWRLDEAAIGEDLERVRCLRESIGRKVGGDLSFRSLHQPIRVPGTIHGKHGRPAPVRILQDTRREYSLGDLEEAVGAMPALAAPSTPRVAVRQSKPRDLANRIIREGGVDGVTRFDALSTRIGHHVRNIRTGLLTEDEAWDAVRDYNATSISPPWDERRLRREFEALRKRDAANHGAQSAALDRPHPAPVARSEDALAATFVARHGQNWRHVAAWGAWMLWTGTHWTRDETGAVRECARQICRDVALRCEKPNESRRIASQKTMAATLRIAATDPRIATGSADWDRHPMLLNTPAGTVDLETGEIRPHEAGLHITQMTTASPGSNAPQWVAFLKEITDGNADLQAYLARLAGYCLTGSTSEQVFAFLHGAGANGKSVFLQVLSAVLGNYAATAAQETFMASRTDRHLSELAGLRSARLVIVGETEAGRAWAESRIKQVTGGEKIRANYMRQDFFEFTPQFKLLIAGNHLPGLSGVGEAMRRRLQLIPFTVTIPAERRDRHLTARLLKEADGILGWMLKGCAEWQRMGLSPPASATAAAEDYFEDEDLVGQWIGECCETGPTRQAAARALFDSWSRWAEAAGIAPGSQKSLGAALRDRGFRASKLAGARGWSGIAPRRRTARPEAAE